jgi:hypothetical protein
MPPCWVRRVIVHDALTIEAGIEAGIEAETEAETVSVEGRTLDGADPILGGAGQTLDEVVLADLRLVVACPWGPVAHHLEAACQWDLVVHSLEAACQWDLAAHRSEAACRSEAAVLRASTPRTC